MSSNERLCITCHVPMVKATIKHRGLSFETRQCPQCSEKIFTEELTMKAITQLEKKRLEEEYVKQPIKIGHSWGVTFPKEIAEVFHLNNRKTKLVMHPNVEKNRIEIVLG